MEIKKSKKANLEKNKSMFIQLGLVIALSIILVAFEWTSNPSKNEVTQMVQDIEFEDEMIITRREQPKEEIKQELPKVAEVLEIVEDDVEIDDFDFDMEVDDNTEYDFIITEDEEEIIEEDVPFIIVSNMPKFQGGDLNTFWAWCQENASYPEIAAENGVSGVVTVQFIINKQGYVDKVTVLRSVDPALDNEAIRVVKSSPRWTPGDQRGKPASVMMTIPIRFILQ
jgi:protein TonB